MEERTDRKGIGNKPQRIAERVLLLREYLCANANRTHAVRIEDMKQYLNDKGDNCGVKPIYRALAILTSDFGLQLEYSEKYKGWVLNNPPFTQNELRLIVDSIQASKFITQEKAKQLTSKIRGLAGAEGKESLNRPAYVYERIKSMNDAVVKEVDRIYQARKPQRPLRLQHLRQERQAHQWRIHRPGGGQALDGGAGEKGGLR